MSIVVFNIIIPLTNSKSFATITPNPLVVITDSPINDVNDINDESVRDLIKGLGEEGLEAMCNEKILTLPDWVRARVSGRIIDESRDEEKKFVFGVNDLWALELERVRCAMVDTISLHQKKEKRDCRIDNPIDRIRLKSDMDPKLKLALRSMLDGLKISERYPDFYAKCIKSLGTTAGDDRN